MAPPRGSQEEKPYEHQEFPKWMYHRTSPPLLCRSPAVVMALGGEWKESPADFKAPVAEGLDPSDHASYYALKQEEVIDRIDEMQASDGEPLRMLHDIEIAHPRSEGGRAKILAAIKEKLEALE